MSDATREGSRNRHTGVNHLNLVLLVVVSVVGVALLWVEGYLPLLKWPFLVYGVVISGFAFWVAAFEISTRRFLWLIVVAGVGGYLTQWVGSTQQGIWLYQGPQASYYFVPSMFVLAATVAYGLVVMVLCPRLPRWLGCLPRWPNLLLVALLFAIVVVGTTRFREGGDLAFWIYYGGLTLFALYAGLLIDFATLLAVCLAALVVGGAGESLGAHSGLWLYVDTGIRPPAFLVLASWPLEVILHWGLSALLARETLLAKRRVVQGAHSTNH